MQFSTQCTKTVVSINMTRSLLSTCLVLYRSRRSLLMKACRIVSLCSPWRDRVNLCRPMENYKTIGMYCNAICVPQCVFQRTQNTSKMELKQLNMPYKTELMLKAVCRSKMLFTHLKSCFYYYLFYFCIRFAICSTVFSIWTV